MECSQEFAVGPNVQMSPEFKTTSKRLRYHLLKRRIFTRL